MKSAPTFFSFYHTCIYICNIHIYMAKGRTLCFLPVFSLYTIVQSKPLERLERCVFCFSRFSSSVSCCLLLHTQLTLQVKPLTPFLIVFHFVFTWQETITYFHCALCHDQINVFTNKVYTSPETKCLCRKICRKIHSLGYCDTYNTILSTLVSVLYNTQDLFFFIGGILCPLTNLFSSTLFLHLEIAS